jgi:hypothetical protein
MKKNKLDAQNVLTKSHTFMDSSIKLKLVLDEDEDFAEQDIFYQQN